MCMSVGTPPDYAVLQYLEAIMLFFVAGLDSVITCTCTCIVSNSERSEAILRFH